MIKFENVSKSYKGEKFALEDINIDIKKGNILLGQYIQRGYFPSHLDKPDRIFSDFEEKCTIMKQELYKKEYNEFIPTYKKPIKKQRIKE